MIDYQANREIWASALESGKYPQTTHCLKDTDGFCCLGVAQFEFAPGKFEIGERAKLNSGMGAYPSFEVTELLGLTDADCQHFVDLNDHVGLDFTQIAAEVRALPPVSSSTKIRKEF